MNQLVEIHEAFASVAVHANRALMVLVRIHSQRWALRELMANGIDYERFVRGISSTRTVEAGRRKTTGVVQSDQLPLPVEYRATGTARLRRRSVMQPGIVMVEHQVVLKRELRLLQPLG